MLDGLDLELRPGETVALVGESGAGKSTVASLLLRLAEPERGRVTVGGVDLAACDTAEWRRQLAWVPQHPTIFRGHGRRQHPPRPGAARATRRCTRPLRSRARTSSCGRSRCGYETLVGDGGRPLSAGERRRIALARAFLRDAPLVVLDEPTADLDPESAALVARALESLRLGRTMLVIAHRQELARRADRVIVLEAGKAAPLSERAAA